MCNLIYYDYGNIFLTVAHLVLFVKYLAVPTTSLFYRLCQTGTNSTYTTVPTWRKCTLLMRGEHISVAPIIPSAPKAPAAILFLWVMFVIRVPCNCLITTYVPHLCMSLKKCTGVLQWISSTANIREIERDDVHSFHFILDFFNH